MNWPPSSSRRDLTASGGSEGGSSPNPVQKLINTHNTCYMNATIQALAACEPLHLYLYYLTHEDIEQDSTNNSYGKPGKPLNQSLLKPHPFIRLMAAQLLELVAPKNAAVRPVLINFAQLRKRFTYGEQQDAHEFFVYMFDGIEENRKKLVGSLRLMSGESDSSEDEEEEPKESDEPLSTVEDAEGEEDEEADSKDSDEGSFENEQTKRRRMLQKKRLQAEMKQNKAQVAKERDRANRLNAQIANVTRSNVAESLADIREALEMELQALNPRLSQDQLRHKNYRARQRALEQALKDLELSAANGSADGDAEPDCEPNGVDHGAENSAASAASPVEPISKDGIQELRHWKKSALVAALRAQVLLESPFTSPDEVIQRLDGSLPAAYLHSLPILWTEENASSIQIPTALLAFNQRQQTKERPLYHSTVGTCVSNPLLTKTSAETIDELLRRFEESENLLAANKGCFPSKPIRFCIPFVHCLASNMRMIAAEIGDWRSHKLHSAAAQQLSSQVVAQIKLLFESGVSLWKSKLAKFEKKFPKIHAAPLDKSSHEHKVVIRNLRHKATQLLTVYSVLLRDKYKDLREGVKSDRDIISSPTKVGGLDGLLSRQRTPKPVVTEAPQVQVESDVYSSIESLYTPIADGEALETEARRTLQAKQLHLSQLEAISTTPVYEQLDENKLTDTELEALKQCTAEELHLQARRKKYTSLSLQLDKLEKEMKEFEAESQVIRKRADVIEHCLELINAAFESVKYTDNADLSRGQIHETSPRRDRRVPVADFLSELKAEIATNLQSVATSSTKGNPSLPQAPVEDLGPLLEPPQFPTALSLPALLKADPKALEQAATVPSKGKAQSLDREVARLLSLTKEATKDHQQQKSSQEQSTPPMKGLAFDFFPGRELKTTDLVVVPSKFLPSNYAALALLDAYHPMKAISRNKEASENNVRARLLLLDIPGGVQPSNYGPNSRAMLDKLDKQWKAEKADYLAGKTSSGFDSKLAASLLNLGQNSGQKASALSMMLGVTPPKASPAGDTAPVSAQIGSGTNSSEASTAAPGAQPAAQPAKEMEIQVATSATHVTANPFVSVIKSILYCQKCGTEWSSSQAAYDVGLYTPHVPNARTMGSRATDLTVPPGSYSVEECLTLFVKSEEVEHVFCETCKRKRKLKKRLAIDKLPQVLCVHLHRLHQSGATFGRGLQKTRTQVTFDSTLDMTPFVTKSLPSFKKIFPPEQLAGEKKKSTPPPVPSEKEMTPERAAEEFLTAQLTTIAEEFDKSAQDVIDKYHEIQQQQQLTYSMAMRAVEAQTAQLRAQITADAQTQRTQLRLRFEKAQTQLLLLKKASTKTTAKIVRAEDIEALRQVQAKVAAEISTAETSAMAAEAAVLDAHVQYQMARMQLRKFRLPQITWQTNTICSPALLERRAILASAAQFLNFSVRLNQVTSTLPLELSVFGSALSGPAPQWTTLSSASLAASSTSPINSTSPTTTTIPLVAHTSVSTPTGAEFDLPTVRAEGVALDSQISKLSQTVLERFAKADALFNEETKKLHKRRELLAEESNKLKVLHRKADEVAQSLAQSLALGTPEQQRARQEAEISQHNATVEELEERMRRLTEGLKNLDAREAEALATLAAQRHRYLSALLAQLRAKEEASDKEKLDELQVLQATHTKRKDEAAKEAQARQKELEAKRQTSSALTLTLPNGTPNGLNLEDLIFDRRNNLYELVAVVQHLGSETGGHYIVYRKIFQHMAFSSSHQYNQYLSEIFHDSEERGEPPKRYRWVMVSDTEVHPVTEAQVKRAEAYMLYYQKVDSRSESSF